MTNLFSSGLWRHAAAKSCSLGANGSEPYTSTRITGRCTPYTVGTLVHEVRQARRRQVSTSTFKFLPFLGWTVAPVVTFYFLEAGGTV
jgi:hypothetical protein